MRKNDKDREVDFEELKAIIFHCAKGEMEGYLKAREKWDEKIAEIQRQRYVSIYQVILKAKLEKEFETYQAG